MAKVEAFFSGNPPWSVRVELIIEGSVIRTYEGQFSHDEGISGYDRVLKSNFQRFNDEMIMTAVEVWFNEFNEKILKKVD